ncbi:MAG: MFS transporter [Alphaproteobacteria bacterium]|nr:MFS transporter [Alphaproteobacteria bacterium]MCD8571551.1 MFS transporter [Alphaproteobacteria bacterium]
MQGFRDFCARENIDKGVIATIMVAALGYLVDIFDLLLFSIVRVQSLIDLGLEGEELLSYGILLINSQMAGLLIGGILWGVWGDRVGRVSVLFGSILTYSLANIANGFVQDVHSYAVLRFIAGIGLAGELGAGITLASELIPRKYRGLGTTFIASIGVGGAVLAALVAELTDWRTAYIIGGVMGLALLVLRLNVTESGLFKKVSTSEAPRGNFLMLFTNFSRFRRYLAIILVGAPIWAVVGLFVTFAPEFGKAFGMVELPSAGTAVLFCYAGLMAGDAFSGLLSQYLQSRRRSIMVSLALTTASVFLYITLAGSSLFMYYGLCLLLGFAIGFWAMFIQLGAEQFGTNIRATAATTVPNMVRASTIPITMAFHALIPMTGVLFAGTIVVLSVVVLAFVSLLSLKETFHTDLDYIEG